MKQSAFIAALKFASHAMAIKDTRYYLNGVLLEFRAPILTLVGTDGHRMAYVEVDNTSDEGANTAFTLSADSVKLLLAGFKQNSTAYLFFEHGTDVLIIRGANDQAIVCKPVGGKYPDWRRVCKSGATPKGTERIGMNSDYLAAASKACGALDGTRYSGMILTLHGKTESILCKPRALPTGISEAAVVIMPMIS